MSSIGTVWAMEARQHVTNLEVVVLAIAWLAAALVGIAFAVAADGDDYRLLGLFLIGPPYFLSKEVLARRA